LIPKINEIKAAKGGEAAAQQISNSRHPEVSETLNEFVEETGTDSQRQTQWSPKPLVRSVVATFEPYDKLGRLAKAEAYHRGFATAREKAFVADGHLGNWSIQQTYFPDYTPILDPMHAFPYVYEAAQLATMDMEECWQLCKPWITWIWQGKVDRVIDDLDQRIAQTTDAAVLETLNTSRTYLHNNRERMHYDDYRRRGLPITSALMESTIKELTQVTEFGTILDFFRVGIVRKSNGDGASDAEWRCSVDLLSCNRQILWDAASNSRVKECSHVSATVCATEEWQRTHVLVPG
jgi:hypothetical protein